MNREEFLKRLESQSTINGYNKAFKKLDKFLLKNGLNDQSFIDRINGLPIHEKYNFLQELIDSFKGEVDPGTTRNYFDRLFKYFLLCGCSLDYTQKKIRLQFPRKVGKRFEGLDPQNIISILKETSKVFGGYMRVLVGGGIRDYLRAARIGNRFRKLSLEDEQMVLDIFTKSAGEFLDGWFESDAVKAAFAFDSIVGFYGSPHTPGSAYVLLHHAFGEVNGKKGVWGHAIGGMGAITQAMAKSAQRFGAEVRVDCPVKSVRIEDGRATGVVLESGAFIPARVVAANVGPKLLFTQMVDHEVQPPAFAKRMENLACGSGVFRMNVALKGLPRFKCLQGRKDAADYLTAGIVIGPTMDYLDKAYTDARREGSSRQPIIEMLIPSLLDDTLAPEGKHVASLFCQQFAFDLPQGAPVTGADLPDLHRVGVSQTVPVVLLAL